METELISLPDYIHAIQVVAASATRACPGLQLMDLHGQATLALVRIEAARQRLGICAVEPAEFERIAGQPLPSRVVAWLLDCGRRMAARDFTSLAADVLALCHALEKTLRACLCRSRIRPGSRIPSARRVQPEPPSYRYSASQRAPRRGRMWRRPEEPAVFLR